MLLFTLANLRFPLPDKFLQLMYVFSKHGKKVSSWIKRLSLINAVQKGVWVRVKIFVHAMSTIGRRVWEGPADPKWRAALLARAVLLCSDHHGDCGSPCLVALVQTSAQTGSDLPSLRAKRAHGYGTWAHRWSLMQENQFSQLEFHSFTGQKSLTDKQPPEISWSTVWDLSKSTFYDVCMQTNNCFQL